MRSQRKVQSDFAAGIAWDRAHVTPARADPTKPGHAPGIVLYEDGSSLRAYFVTETNNQANLLIYDVTPWVNRYKREAT